jgi:DNA-binding transcriptional MerR regulator
MTERLWYKIGEASRRIGVTPKELRYWEKVIPELKPRRSQGNLRYYHIEEFPRLERIRRWLAEGFTVADCRELLNHGQLTRQLDLGLEEDTKPTKTPTGNRTRGGIPDEALRSAITALKSLARRLSKPLPSSPRRKRPLDQPPETT